MNERIIDIILYLVAQIRQKTSIEQVDVKRLADDGYTQAEIGAAYSWLVDRASLELNDELGAPRRAHRVLHEAERSLFHPNAYGYLIQLFEIGLIGHNDFETIINRAFIAGLYSLSVADIKSLIGVMVTESGELGLGGSRLMLVSSDMVH